MAAVLKNTPTLASGTSCTIPSHAVGDLLLVGAYRTGSTTAPTIPTAGGTVPAWVQIDGGTGANTECWVTAYFVATATNHTTGTWTNATCMVAMVATGFNTSTPIGGHARGGGATANQAIIPSITQTDTTGASLLLQWYGSRGQSSWGSANSGYTDQGTPVTSSSGGVNVSTKDDTTTDGGITRTITTTTSGSYGLQIEVLAAVAAPTLRELLLFGVGT